MNFRPPYRHISPAIALVASAALLLGGCSSDSDDNSDTTSAESSTRQFTATNGTFEIPSAPQRIVAIGGSVGQIIDLGVKPVGVSEQNDNFTEWLSQDSLAAYEGATNVGPIAKLDYEKIASLDPDLILVTAPQPVFESAVDEDRLQTIAPTLFDEPATTEWKEAGGKMANAVNAGGAFDEGREAYEAVVDDITAKYSDILKDSTFAFVNKWDASDSTSYDREFAAFTCTTYVADIGMNIQGEGKSESGANSVKFSLENLPGLNDADDIIYALGADDKPKDGMDTVLNSPLWKNLDAVKNDRAQGVECPFGTFTFNNGVRNLESMKTALAAIAEAPKK